VPAYAAWALALFRDFLLPGDAAPDVRDAFGRLLNLGRVTGAVSPADRRDMALRLLADLKRPLGSKSGVQVLDAMAARGIPFRRLIVLGLNERVFPRFIIEDPFVRDAVRSRIATRLGPRLPSVEGLRRERLLFTLLKESARSGCPFLADRRPRPQVRSTFLGRKGPASRARPPAIRVGGPDALTRKEASILEALSGDAVRGVSSALVRGRGGSAAREFLAKSIPPPGTRWKYLHADSGTQARPRRWRRSRPARSSSSRSACSASGRWTNPRTSARPARWTRAVSSTGSWRSSTAA
jgi:hypothetical protein